jgi:hypothetical protein
LTNTLPNAVIAPDELDVEAPAGPDVPLEDAELAPPPPPQAASASARADDKIRIVDEVLMTISRKCGVPPRRDGYCAASGARRCEDE